MIHILFIIQYYLHLSHLFLGTLLRWKNLIEIKIEFLDRASNMNENIFPLFLLLVRGRWSLSFTRIISLGLLRAKTILIPISTQNWPSCHWCSWSLIFDDWCTLHHPRASLPWVLVILNHKTCLCIWDSWILGHVYEKLIVGSWMVYTVIIRILLWVQSAKVCSTFNTVFLVRNTGLNLLLKSTTVRTTTK